MSYIICTFPFPHKNRAELMSDVRADDEFLESSEDVGPSWRTTARVINAPDSLSELVQFLSVETTSTSHHPLQLQPHKQSSTTDSMFPTPSDDLDSPFSELLSLSLTRGTDSA
ncbi:hypothetical protein NX059_005400 [Plenodomus lindquistii]|nr:hypothetical protein NX059_005400 [Plenodomus lindquistii]